MGRSIDLVNLPPKRIISIVPSQTELLFDLGLENEVVGITKFCIYPDTWFQTKSRVGGTKEIDIEKVRLLNPDLIIGNKEENSKADVAELEKIAPVWMSDIYHLSDSFQMMKSIGEICQVPVKATNLIQEIERKFDTFETLASKKNVMYLIWNNPLMAAAKRTFIDSMLTRFGLNNYYNELERYPLCSENKAEDPDYIFLSSEPFPFKQKHADEIQLQYPKSKLIFVDGEMFSWYGSRLRKVPEYFRELTKQL